MDDSVLKKEFDRKDVQRLRNIIKKDFNAATSVQSGYNKINDVHNEGDVWEENGKKWTIKNGIRQNITKLDSFRELVNMPLACPKCKSAMNNPNDKKMYIIHKICSSCVIDFETQLKIQGKYEEYERGLIKGNIKHFLKDYEDFITDSLTNNSNKFITEQGDVEEWKGNIDKERILKTAKEFIDNTNKSLDT